MGNDLSELLGGSSNAKDNLELLGKSIKAAPRMAGDAFKLTKRGRGLGALLGLVEKGLIMTGTPYGKKVKAARDQMDQAEADFVKSSLSKLGL